MKQPTGRRVADTVARQIAAETARAKLWKQLEPRLKKGLNDGVSVRKLAKIANDAGYEISVSTLWRRLGGGKVKQ